MVKIIVNADDFGKSIWRNRAIDDSIKQGLITSAGMIVTGKHLQEAVELANNGGYVDRLHLHFNLSANLLHEDSDDIPLTEAMRKDSFFCKGGKFKKYRGIPHKFTDIRKWKMVYDELVSQYSKFKEVTEGKADYNHVDFHLWYNLSWPVAVALRKFTRKFDIKSVRYIGMHQMNIRRYRLFYSISQIRKVKYIPSTNIDFFLSKRDLFDQYPVVELYCHPNYKDGVFLDDSPSYLGHDRQPMAKQIEMLKDAVAAEFVTWREI